MTNQGNGVSACDNPAGKAPEYTLGHDGHSSSPAKFCVMCRTLIGGERYVEGIEVLAHADRTICKAAIARGAPLPTPSPTPQNGNLRDYDAAKEIRERFTRAKINFSGLTWRDTESLVEDAILPLRNEIKRLRELLLPYLQAESAAPVEPEILRQWRDPKVAWLSPWHKEILAYIDGLKGKLKSVSKSD